MFQARFPALIPGSPIKVELSSTRAGRVRIAQSGTSLFVDVCEKMHRRQKLKSESSCMSLCSSDTHLLGIRLKTLLSHQKK